MDAKTRKRAAAMIRGRIRTVLRILCSRCDNRREDFDVSPSLFACECEQKGWMIDYQDHLLCPECSKRPINERGS